jgi:pimeloyl-ACP methyl ester carboxylesterase
MTPHYATTSYGQLRLFVSGAGRPIVVLPGLIHGAAMLAARLAQAAPDLGWHVLELPGIGGSAGVPVGRASEALVAAREALGLDAAPVLACDLAAALHDGPCVRLDATAAAGWAARGIMPPDLAPRADGTHLTALFAHIRDRHVLDPADPGRAARAGEKLPDAAELDSTVVAAAVDPVAYAALWRRCLSAPSPGAADTAAAIAALRAMAGPDATTTLPPTQPRPPLWCDHADLPRGRQHLRRAGSQGRLLIALQSAPGTAAPLAPLLAGLAPIRRVVAPDYIGNGDSARPDHPVDIARLARDTLDLADALGERTFDLWGTHTGALIALEAALLAPERVGRLILEAPPLLAPEFTADILANYLPKLLPHPWGLHLQQAWCMRRDMFLFWPWYRAERAAARPLTLPDAAFLHDWTVGLLKSGSTYDHSYRAAFEYDTSAALRRLTRPALLCAGPADMLADGLAVAATLAPDVLTVAPMPATVWYPNQGTAAIARTIAAYAAFLDEGMVARS